VEPKICVAKRSTMLANTAPIFSFQPPDWMINV
jgi:hypothetical protein